MPDLASPPTADCAQCPYKNAERICMNLEGKHPGNCPTLQGLEVIAKAATEYEKPEIRAFARQASLQEADPSSLGSWKSPNSPAA
jgi:hypothetical protein